MKLEPCPFCGGHFTIRPGLAVSEVECRPCGYKFQRRTIGEALTAANRRADGWVSVEERRKQSGELIAAKLTSGEYEVFRLGDEFEVADLAAEIELICPLPAPPETE